LSDSASQLLTEGRLEEAVAACDRVLALDPDSVGAELTKSEALLRLGYCEQAIEGSVRILRMQKDNTHARCLFERGVAARRGRNANLAAITSIDGSPVARCLGIGREGAVYLIRQPGGRMRVAKIFHPHIVRGPAQGWQDALTSVSAHLKSQSQQAVDTLYPFDVLKIEGAVRGVFYEHEHLTPIRARHLMLPDVGRAIMSAFFRTQAYLCAHLGTCLTDAHLANFMMTGNGSLRFIDYGKESFKRSAGPRDELHELFALIRLACQLFQGIRLRPDAGCRIELALAQIDALRSLAARHEWLRTVMSSVDARTYSDFFDAGYYARLSAQLPRRIGQPAHTIIRLSNDAGVVWHSTTRSIRRAITGQTRRTGVSAPAVESIYR
jgi:hypothetical protein